MIDLGQFAEQLLLALGQGLRRFHQESDEQVAAPSTAQVRHALPAQVLDVPALDAGLELVRDRSVERGDLDFAAKSGLSEADRHLADQVIAVALKERVVAHVHAHDQIAARCSGLTSLALAPSGNLQSRESPRRNVDLQGAPVGDVPLAATLAARIGNDRAASAAAATGLLHAEEALAGNHHAVSVAMLARRRPAAFAHPRSGTVRTQLFAREGDRFFDAAVSVVQLDFEVVDEVVSGLRAAAATAPAEQVAEDVRENVKDRFRRLEVRQTRAVQASVAVAVVDLAFVRIAEDGVSFGSFLELGRRLFVAGVAVGVVLHGQSAVGLLDLVVRGLALETQDFVVVPLLRHSSL